MIDKTRSVKFLNQQKGASRFFADNTRMAEVVPGCGAAACTGSPRLQELMNTDGSLNE
jgi:hypothetical protein